MTITARVIESAPPTGQRHAAHLRRRLIIRPSRSAVGIFCILALLVAGIAAYFDRVSTAAPISRYTVAAPSPQWLQAPAPAAVSWYRADVMLPTAPTAGVLWVDARDMYQVWINGRVATTNRTPARAGALPTGSAVDVRSLLKAGQNTIAVQVSGLGDESAALWARLRAETPTGAVDLGTDSAQWRVTSDAGLTGSRLGLPPKFVDGSFPITGWTPATPVPALRSTAVTVPDLLLRPSALAAVSVRGFDATYSLAADVSTAVDDSWLRVSATGALSVTVNGRLAIQEPAPGYQSPNSHRSAPQFLVHVGRLLHKGTNTLVFHVTGSGTTAVAVSGFVSSASSRFEQIPASDQRWTVTAQGVPMAADPLGATGISAIWPNGFNATVVPVDSASDNWLQIATDILPTWLLLMLLLALALVLNMRTLRIPAGVLMGRVVLCLGPASAAIVAILAYGRWITVTPGFPYSDPAAAVVIVLLAVPVLGLAVAAGLRRRTRVRARVPSSPLHADVSGRSRWVLLRRPLHLPFGLEPHRAVIVLIAILAGVAQAWRIGRQPLWQDEVTSIVVGRSISEHGLPQLDSGLFYFKAEFYHGLLALVMSVSDNPDVLRLVALFWFVLTVLAFGLLLMPTLTASRRLQAVATAVLVLVPAELAWARDIRMYQQMQFFAVVFIALFIRALRTGRSRDIIGSAIALLAMYFSHEESFVILPALPLMALAARHVVWFRWRVFAASFVPAGVLIAVQYGLSHIHPPDFGEDLSNRPYVGWDPNQADFYYQKIFFSPIAQSGSLTVLSTLAVVAIIVGWRRGETATRLAGIGLVVTVTAISLVLTAKVDRYSFVTIPLLVALAVMGAAYLFGLLARWRTRLTAAAGHRQTTGWLRGTVVATCVISVLAILATLVVSPRGFGLWAADLTDSPNPLTHPDYAPTMAYLRAHERPGDQVITLAPPVMAQQYLGTVPDRVIQTGRNKLLYLVLRNGQAVETILGVPVLLTGDQIRIFLEAHPRVWLVSDAGSYIQGVPPDVRTEVSKDFTIVAQDAATTVSLWDAG